MLLLFYVYWSVFLCLCTRRLYILTYLCLPNALHWTSSAITLVAHYGGRLKEGTEYKQHQNEWNYHQKIFRFAGIKFCVTDYVNISSNWCATVDYLLICICLVHGYDTSHFAEHQIGCQSCLTAQSQYINQCRFAIKCIMCDIYESKYMKNTSATNHYNY